MNYRFVLPVVCLSSVASAQWNQLAPANAPSARIEPQMAFDPGNNVTVLFGGADLGGFPPTTFSDTWTWDGIDWTQAAPVTSPPGRYFGSMSYDFVRGVTVLYGGLQPTFFGANALDDTWEWDGTNWTQVVTANSPGSYIGNPGVGEVSIAYDPVGLKTVLFGGELFNGIVPAPATTFEYDGTDWVEVNTGVQPPRRSQTSLCAAPTLGGVLLFGGTNFNNPPGPGGEITWNDTWVYSSLTSTWREIVVTGPVPQPRAGASLEFDPASGAIIMSGGYGDNMGMIAPLSDTWLFDGVAGTWTDVTVPLGAPTGPLLRFESSQGPGGCGVIFGGADAVFGTANNNTWVQGCVGTGSVYGAGCVGSNGTPNIVPTSQPQINSTFSIAATNFATSSALGIMGIGLSDTLSGLGALPLSLAPFGLGAGCDLLHSFDGSAAMSMTSGSGSYSIALPNLGAFIGYEAYFQGFSLDTGAAGGIAVSNGVKAVIGY